MAKQKSIVQTGAKAPDEQKVKAEEGAANSNQNIHSVTVSVSNSIGKATQTQSQPLVKVLIRYPQDWNKVKFFQDGDMKEVSPETAKTFIEIGIATEVKE